MDRQYVEDGVDYRLNAINDTISPILVIKHMKRPKITVHKEVIAYTFGDFLSDVGGLMGMFLGASFWSIYELTLRPLLHSIGHRIKSA